jgi:tetratricopeptide (TPR) repeat protein
LRPGRPADAGADREAAAAAARAAGDRLEEASCLLHAATALDWTNDYGAAEARAEAARAAAGDGPGPLLEARLELARGRALLRAGRVAGACEVLGGAARLAAPLGDAGYETLVVALVLLVFAHATMGREDEAERTGARAMALALEHGDRVHAAVAQNNLHALHAARGRLAEALEGLDAYLRVGRELGDASIEYVAQHNAGELLYLAGRPADAALRTRRARELEERHPVSAFRHGALLEARLHVRGGDAEGALQRLAVVAAGGPAPAPSVEVLVDAVEASARGAGRAAWEAIAARARAHSPPVERAEVVELWALAAARAGRHGEAAEALEVARALVAEGARILAPRLAATAALIARLAAGPGPS